MVEAMEIETGFKQTEVGVLPNDWTLEPFTEIASLKHGFQFLEEHFAKLGIGVIKIANLIDGSGLNLSDLTFVPFDSLKRFEKFQLTKGDVLMALTGATFGKVCKVDTNVILFQNYRVGNFIPNTKTTRDYIYHVSQSTIVQKIVKDLVNSGAQPNLGKKDFDKILISLPSTIAEQTAIATALNDADALIAGLEKLIAKKRNIKQGAMQELLKPKEGWELRAFSEVSFMKGRIGWQGLKQSEFTMNPDEPFLITGMNFKDGEIRWDEVYHVSEERYQIAKEIQLKKGDVLMTKDGTIGKLLYVKEIPYPGKATLNSHLLVFRPIGNSYDPLYLYYNLSSLFFKNHIELNKSGTTFFGISQETVSKYKIHLPTLETQNRIAQILSNMDTEIEALEKKLEKYKMIKQGMMQNLLTGRIRLI